MNYSTKVFDFFSDNKKTYYNYLSLNNKTEVISENVSTHLNLLNYKDKRFNHKKIRILCVGGGSGETDLSIIEKLSSKNFIINYIDPSIEMQTGFIAELKKRKLTKTGDIKVSPFEANSYSPPKSDIILCLNSIYFLKGWKSINKNNPLLKIYNTLDQKGIAIIVLKSDTSPHTKVKKSGNGGKTCGKNIRNILQKLKIPHYWETISSHINISNCFKNGKFDPNKKGISLLSFMFKGEWKLFSKETKKNISKTIRNKMEITDSKHLLRADYECIWITKPEKTQNPGKINNDSVNDKTSKLSSILRKEIKNFVNFPQPGINFKDMTEILRNPFLFKKIVNYVSTKYSKNNIDFVVAKDMQGLIWAGAIALKMGIGMIPMFRKDLPGPVISSIYSHEYNPHRVINLQKKAIKPGQKILIVDYIIATGETVRNMIRLIEHLGGKVAGVFSIAELTYLNSRYALENYPINTIVKY